jgi:polyhydroxyalkanoate synthase
MGTPQDWLAGATFHQGSWWPRWGAWLARQSGGQVKARVPGDSGAPVLCPAPGTYVMPKSNP